MRLSFEAEGEGEVSRIVRALGWAFALKGAGVEVSGRSVPPLIINKKAARKAFGSKRMPLKKAAQTTALAISPSEIRGIRKRTGLTRPKFAKKIGASTWSVFMWEHGKVLPGPKSVKKLRAIAAEKGKV